MDFNHSKSYKVSDYDKLNKLKLVDSSDLNTSNKSDLNNRNLTKNNRNLTNSSSSKTYLLKSQVVTSNKFEQNLREIDGSVAVASGKELQDLQIQSTKDLPKIFPGLVLNEQNGPNNIRVTIRGIGTAYFYNPSIVLYVDGIPQNPQYLSQEMLDVDRVELLRGPQGTIWGQNAQGGVLNIRYQSD